MMQKVIFLVFALFFSVAAAQVATEGGNTTQLNPIEYFPSSYWSGFYGEVILSTYTEYNATAVSNNVSRLNLFAQMPNCTYTSFVMHVIAVNSSAISLPLTAGNLSVLDNFVNKSLENGSNTFGINATFNLSYGTYANVPAVHLYANGTQTSSFEEGYLNDANGNLVFVARVANDSLDWNGTTSDYELLLPTNGSPVNYTVWVDVNYTCATPPSGGGGGGGGANHRLLILPLPTYEVKTGQVFNVVVEVENKGDYAENDVAVFFDCPATFSCANGTIAKIKKGERENITLQMTAGKIGEYVIAAHAKNDHNNVYREFIVRVLPECYASSECAADRYCESGECKPKKEVNKTCSEDVECISNLCDGVCVLCKNDEDCGYDSVCESGVCKKITCQCGLIENHKCLPYQCCADSDCGSNEFCIKNKCVPKELDLVLSVESAVEGDLVRVQVINNKGDSVPFARIFTDESEVIGDENGFGKINAPYNGIIYASKDGYNQVGKILNVIKKGFFVIDGEVFAGSETRIRIVDSKGNPIADAEVFVDGVVKKTDKNGYFTHTFESAGTKILRAKKNGYLISDAELVVKAAGAIKKCDYPIFLNLISFFPNTIYQLWLISVLIALANYYITSRKLEWKRRYALVYSFLPLILAIPDVWLLNICFLSNVVLLEFIFSVLRWITRKRMEKEKRKKETKTLETKTRNSK